MRTVVKKHETAFNKGNYHFKKSRNQKIAFKQESMDFFATNVIKDMPFMSQAISMNFNKYLINSIKNKFSRIKNFLNMKPSTKDDLETAFEKLNFIRLKITILERDISAYRHGLKNSFDAKDTNRLLQKRILQKYAKLRKYDTYQNLNLGIIYDKSITAQKLKAFETDYDKKKESITAKYNSTEALTKMQKEFIYKLIYLRQNEDNVFINDVSLDTLKELLIQNPRYVNQLSNIDTFTNEYLNQNPGSLSKAFVKFKFEHKKSNINKVVKSYLDLYTKKHPETNNTTLNNIQRQLLSSFTYKDFKKSDIFYEMDRANSVNDILLRAKINFIKMQICKELEFCMDLPEINNYFKILEHKEEIPNYVVSTERLFVDRIEKEFPEIKTSSFIYLYNKVRSILNTYRLDIVNAEQYLVSDFVNTVIREEFENPNDKEKVKNTLKDISNGIYKNPQSIETKNNLDLYTRLITQFTFIKLSETINFSDKLQDSKLFHGVLVTDDMQPILPLKIQRKIMKLPLDAQKSLAVNYHNNNILDILDDIYISDNGELKTKNKKIEFGLVSMSTIQHLSFHQVKNRIEEYLYFNKDNYYIEDEVELAKYILEGVNNDLNELVLSNIDMSANIQFSNKSTYFDNENEMENEENFTEISNTEISNNDEKVEEDRKLEEVINFKKARKYIGIILDEKQSKTQSQMLLALQKRINSKMLPLTEIQLDNLNEDLKPISLSLRTPKNYVDHLINKYKESNRDLNSLQVGLKLRVRVGHLVLTDEEITEINENNNFDLIQRPTLKTRKDKAILQYKYEIKTKKSKETEEKIKNSDALLRRVVKRTKGKVVPLDIKLFEILKNN